MTWSHGGQWNARAWRVEVEFDLHYGGSHAGAREYPVQRQDLRALTRGWQAHTVTVKTTTGQRDEVEPEWFIYTFRSGLRKEPDEGLWLEVFAASAWESYVHHGLRDHVTGAVRQ